VARSVPVAQGSEVEVSIAEKALRETDNSVETINGYETWAKAVERIRWVMNTLGSIAEV